MEYSKVIIIGAGRSGTNMLRDILCSFEGVETWPCDEINYIWRYGNAKFPTDELKPEHATEKVKNYIRKKFYNEARKKNAQYLVEKTCANTLRIDFVREIFPEAYFIHLIRDGRDVAVSAYERWHAPLDIPYLFKKACFVPYADLAYYATKYFYNRIYKVFNKNKRLSTWGPRFSGMDDIFRNKNPYAACAYQWMKCVEAAMASKEKIPPQKILQIKYEEFVNEPVKEMSEVIDFLKIKVPLEKVQESVSKVSTKSVGRWKDKIPESEKMLIMDEIGDFLKEIGYL